MAKTYGKLKILPVNKTVVFWSPIEGEDVLVRTGTISEGSCLYHALLYAYSDEYVNMDKLGRLNYVKRLRASMIGKIDRESWEEIGGGLIALTPFHEKVEHIITEIYNYLDGNNVGKVPSSVRKVLGTDMCSAEVYKIIAELLPISVITETASNTYKNTDKISSYCDIFLDYLDDHLAECTEIKSIAIQKYEYIKKVSNDFFRKVLEEAETSAFRNYVKGMENMGETIDSNTIAAISDRLRRDIYFLEPKNRIPCNITGNTDNLKSRKSIILLATGKNHYEIVGRLLPGNRIQREFSKDDPLIEKIHTFLVNPNKIPETYPELTPYLPQNYRSKKSPGNSSTRSGSSDSECSKSPSSTDASSD